MSVHAARQSREPLTAAPQALVIMGVSGCGKRWVLGSWQLCNTTGEVDCAAACSQGHCFHTMQTVLLFA
jgi:hypothetical protein